MNYYEYEFVYAELITRNKNDEIIIVLLKDNFP